MVRDTGPIYPSTDLPNTVRNTVKNIGASHFDKDIGASEHSNYQKTLNIF